MQNNQTMSDVEAEREEQDGLAFDDESAHQTCYIFEPFAVDSFDLESPTKKRRKTKHTADEPLSPFPLLNQGAEAAQLAHLRQKTYQKLWTRKQARIDELIRQTDEEAVAKITDFVRSTNPPTPEKLCVGLIISGPDGGAQVRLLERWKANQDGDTSEVVVQLRASHCINLQTTLKNIIKTAIASQIGMEGYQDFLNKHKRLIPMNFDLELLQNFIKDDSISRIVLSILDVETFDIVILSELFSTLSAWSRDIPFVALLGIATTVELFESRLSKSTIDILDATTFTLQSTDSLYDQILDDMVNDAEQAITFGPTTISALREMIQSQGVTVELFTNAVRYAYMSHFFANSLSVLLADSDSLPADKALCTAIRNTTSFQTYCEDLIASKNKSNVQVAARLLDDDTKLLEAARLAVRSNSRERKQIDGGKTPVFNLPEATTINTRAILHPFTPRPRHAVERALGKPADYLACECCRSSDNSSSTPPTSILYTLFQEAGTVINVRDLYDAFCARAFPKDHLDEDDEEINGGDKANRKQLSIFYTALAELKMLGLVKSSTSAVIKKKAMATSGGSDGMNGDGRGRDRYGDVDFVAKTSWAGL